MNAKLTVCVGSSCHLRGSRDVLKRFAEIINREHLDQEATLLGSFCLGRCGEGINWEFNDEEVSSVSVEEAEEALRGKLSKVVAKT